MKTIVISLLGVLLAAQEPAQKQDKVTTHTDPICQMTVKSTAKWSSKYKEKDYYFCNPSCKERFDATPEKYAKATAVKKKM